MSRRIAIAAAAAVAVNLVVIAITGFQLADRYQPTGAAPFEIQPARVQDVARLHDQHVVASYVALAAGVVALVAAVAATSGRPRGRRLVLGGATGVVIVLVGGTVTGSLLAWDQLALWAVTVGTDYKGVWPAAFDDGVRFVIDGTTERSQDDYARSVVVHAVALPLLALAAAAVAAVGIRRVRHRGEFTNR